MTIAEDGATGGEGMIGEVGITGCAWLHQGICIGSPLGHLPCCLRFLMYLTKNCTIIVRRKPRKIPKRRLDPSICALQLKLTKPVLLVVSLCLIMSPNTELSQAPCMSRGQMRGTAGFCWHLPALAFGQHILFLLLFTLECYDCAEIVDYGTQKDD